jgi:hypothetical protein
MPAYVHHTFGPFGGHEGPIYYSNEQLYCVLEQFWGRAVRASCDS